MEELTKELQRKRAERLARLNAGEAASSEMSSVTPSLMDEDRRSLSSEGFVHTSQAGESAEGGGDEQARPKRNKTQLWNEVKITCMCSLNGMRERMGWANAMQLLLGRSRSSTRFPC